MTGRVLITGGTGFVGAAAARAFHRAGYRVFVLVRDKSPLWTLDGLDVIFTRGDLRQPETLKSALEGMDCLCHVAADYRLGAGDPGTIFSVNVDGTRTLMQHALRSGIRRIVHTSSVATLKPGDDSQLGDESSNIARDKAVGAYKLSKLLSEEEIRRMIAEENLPAVIVNPTTPVGPGDVRPTPTGRIILEAARGNMPAFVETGLNFVHVEDVAQGMVAAMERGRIGERYLLGGDNVSLQRFLEQIALETGRKPPRWKIPFWAAMPIAIVDEAVSSLRGREPFATRDGVRMARTPMYFASRKAEHELGYEHRPFQAALRDAIHWFSRNGYIKQSGRP